MRATAFGAELKASAYAGTYVVVLSWDTLDGQLPSQTDLLGYAIERAEIDDEGNEIERYWIKGIKRFKERDKGLPPGTPVPTSEHPIQSFLWADYTAKQNTRYLFRIVPLIGLVKRPKLDFNSEVIIDITTERETEVGDVLNNIPAKTQHDIYFNRGVIGSQAYAREFGNRAPNPDNPESKEMKWLSRGLYEALMKFIGLASDGMGLRACLYEFHYQPVANAFTAAIEAGADVKIIYDAASTSSYKKGNEATIEIAGLDQYNAVIPRTVEAGIRHNKFIILLKDDSPIAVWTGSTNISAGGIFGHSNVGHIIWDEDIASKYLEYWDLLSESEIELSRLRTLNKEITPTPIGFPPENSVTPIFSARDKTNSNETLDWYAELLAGAQELSCMTFAFNIDVVFQNVLSQSNDVLRYVIKDDPLKYNETIGQDRDVIFAAGSYLKSGVLENFLLERSNPLNSNDYIHNKFMLVDPLGNDPIVVTGSANFSKPSQRTNDENMLVIRGDTRVADIYFGEYMRVFDHHYARHIVRILSEEGNGDPNAGFLKEKTSDWLRSHFNPNSYKSKRRKYFTSPE